MKKMNDFYSYFQKKIKLKNEHIIRGYLSKFGPYDIDWKYEKHISETTIFSIEPYNL